MAALIPVEKALVFLDKTIFYMGGNGVRGRQLKTWKFAGSSVPETSSGPASSVTSGRRASASTGAPSGY